MNDKLPDELDITKLISRLPLNDKIELSVKKIKLACDNHINRGTNSEVVLQKDMIFYQMQNT